VTVLLRDFITDGYLLISYNTNIKTINQRRFLMKPNLSTLDRVIRVVVAALFAYLYFAGIVTGAFGIVLLVLGAVFMLTAIVSYCPLYAMFKFRTLKS
jgi:hypothetical protein